MLREHVEMVEFRDGLFFVSWIDDEMGLLAQIIDLEADTVIAAIPVEQEQRTQILRGRPTHGGDFGVATTAAAVIGSSKRGLMSM